MAGSPVRGPNKSSIAQLNHAKDVQDFQAEFVRLIRMDLPQNEVFVGGRERDSNMLQVPSWVRSHLEKHPGLASKLEQGAMVGISHSDENPIPRPASAARSSVVLIPVMHNDTLRGAIGLISPSDGPQLSAEEIESVRQLAYDAAPILSRLQEIDALTTKNHALSAANERIADTQHKMANVIAERNHFDALLKIGWHVQSNIAHELRTPLAAVRGYARMILDGRTGEISDTQRDYLRIIHENTNRLINIANWMTHLADLSAQNFTVAPCDLRKIWAETLRKNQQVLLSKSLTVVEKIPEQSFEIVADAEKLAYGLKELISAAANLSEAGSGITAEFSRGRQHEVMVKISVTGAGVAPEMPSKTPQHSTDSGVQTTGHTDVQKSLNAINEVVGIHGGRMFVNNTAGQGSMLLFTLPAVTLGGEDKSNEQAVNIGRR